MRHAFPSFGEEAGIAAARWRITVRGTVQGVGFRPFVYREAMARALAGWVKNTSAGVVIEAEGSPDLLSGLTDALRHTPPSSARITAIDVREVTPTNEAGFRIAKSEQGGYRSVNLLPDLATCEACLTEMRDPSNRRYRYPFINCTGCGPRYSIIQGLPYDRAHTSMQHFALCAACRAEYHDPSNRRFHAEPTACPTCGPRLTLHDASGEPLETDDMALLAAAQAIRDGSIVAIKGLGGFHLITDARNEAAVTRLRTRKRRSEKPFAVMFPSLAAIRSCCDLTPAAEVLLSSPARPIVLLPYLGGPIAPAVAPGNPRLGVLLPYTPLHHRLMDELGFTVVATSGNLSGEPIMTHEVEARTRLSGIADLFLVHDRPIVRPIDDSVVQIVCDEPQLLRRARGYAPAPIPLAPSVAGLLAVGGQLKTTVALTRETDVVISQHLGDLETTATRQTHAAAINDLVRLHDVTPRVAVCDTHPDYASRLAAERMGLPIIAVQHHLAHVAACLAESGLTPPALGVAWDGTGHGPDGTIWGGEFLLLKRHGWSRVARLRPFRLPGGEAAIREPRRAALGLLYAAYGERSFAMRGLPPLEDFAPEELPILRMVLERGVNAPLTSSMGRLFDACAALVGLHQRSSFEGQAAMSLEGAARDGAAERPYAFVLNTLPGSDMAELDWQPALDSLLADLRAGVEASVIADAWHRGLAHAILNVARHVGEQRVVLAGGCFQNVWLTEATVSALRSGGFKPVWHRQVPPNDGGLALGQVAWTAWGWKNSPGEQPCV
ncbi:hydrogenase maturation protein HypF [Modicisalibacter xianhensis]|uniref:Carbamoyltransferase HypF n=1 Tax=Modicisalibacter xianhensis TaxID=442341 RepID=A0A4R8G3D3_9GAMM|nr:carbamoyltransferase HypF [Halomonas xianhensis]TDX31096.1 hydrogenase maturation protein HypF [Halomonas xianhensis]